MNSFMLIPTTEENRVRSMSLATLEELDKYLEMSLKTLKKWHLRKKDCVPKLRDIPKD